MESERAARGLPVPAWAAPLLVLVAAGLVVWTLFLTYSLPARHTSHDWSIAWAGFDIALAGVLAATAIGLRRAGPWAEATAAVATALLVTDAWFDIVLSDPGGERVEAIVLAVCAEIPLALFCLWIALNVERAIRAVGGTR
jgi:uncharacterized membrane protein